MSSDMREMLGASIHFLNMIQLSISRKEGMKLVEL